MFETFDFAVLDSPDFKEDSVREEIIAPILRRLAYLPSGKARVQRSKTLTHPFVQIGTRKHGVNIVPDYTLWYEDKALLVLDAKSPSEAIIHSHHVEQAYSYAIHPEVRVRHFALCNGKEFVVYDVDESEPVLNVAARDLDARWSEIENHLSPAHLLEPHLRDFQPDLGLAIMSLGIAPNTDIVFPGCSLQIIKRVADDLYTANSSSDFLGGRPHLASFDFPPEGLVPLLSCLVQPLADQVLDALSRSPYEAYIDFMIEVDWRTQLGPMTQGQHDSFAPFLVTEILATRFNSATPDQEPKDVPPYVFRLRQAFDLLKK